MRITTQFVAVALSVKKNEYEKDGKKIEFYQVSFDQDGECGSMSCNKEVYLKGVEKYKPHLFTGIYNDQFGRFEITGVNLYNGKPI